MGRKLLIHNDKVPNIHTLEVYRAHGGYASVEKALKTMQPDQVTDEVKKSYSMLAVWEREKAPRYKRFF